MRQFLFFLLLLFSSSALAFGGLGPVYNGWHFPCDTSLEIAQKLAARENIRKVKASLSYNLGLCEIQHVGLEQGIATLKKSANRGDHAAAITVAEYYKSNGYEIAKAEVLRGNATQNEFHFQMAIDYMKRALQLMSHPDYPFNGPNEITYYIVEHEDQLYLRTADNLGTGYMNRFIDKIDFHWGSVNTSIGNVTVEALQNAQEAAENCLAIPYKENVWEKSVYNKYMSRCEKRKNIAEALLPLEKKRLQVARSQCRNIRLSDCLPHQEIENQMLSFYKVYLKKSEELLASL